MKRILKKFSSKSDNWWEVKLSNEEEQRIGDEITTYNMDDGFIWDPQFKDWIDIKEII